MQTKVHRFTLPNIPGAGRLAAAGGGLLLLLATASAPAATVTIYSTDFESFTSVAASAADTTDADPVGLEWNIADDAALTPTTAGAGVQVINWLPGPDGGPTKCLLVRPATEAQIWLRDTRSGRRYQFDFWLYANRGPTSSHNWYLILRGEGSDYNGDDFIAYRTDRATNSSAIYYYDAVGPGAAAWQAVGTNHLNGVWQHHRMVIDPNALTFDLYVDDMTTPVRSGLELSRCEVAMPTILRIINEANSADDGYFAIDNISLTVEDPIDLATPFTEGFEDYPPRVNADDDADPAGPWITTEMDGPGTARLRAPGKVQVVDSSVVTPHSGNKCLKLEAGQRAGATLAWGTPSLSDVQLTWWARVPAASAPSPGGDATYLRMSLYGAENLNTLAGDNALLGYGIRGGATGAGDATSLTYFAGVRWYDSGVDYTPDTWEEYRLVTYTTQGRYTLIKGPSSASPQVIVDRAPFIGGTTNWFPVFMAAWSSSNGTNHPPVYVDDIQIKAVASVMEPLPLNPYTTTIHGDRFTNVTKLVIPAPVGGVAVDPRDNATILFTLDAAPASGGGIYRASKVATGNWVVDPQPVVGNLDRPSGLTVEANGTIWWVHDFTMALMRLKAPWASNTPELVVTNFSTVVGDDDPIDVCIAPSGFNGVIGQPGWVVVADRGSDTDPMNAVYALDPATTDLYQQHVPSGVPPSAGYWRYLVQPTSSGLGLTNLNAIAPLPPNEVVVLSQDGYITAIDGNGYQRYIYPSTFWPLSGPAPFGLAIATDPTLGRVWLADNTLDEIWSVDPWTGADQKELSFPTVRAEWVDKVLDVHDPGMTFAPNGSLMIVSDTSTVNGGGRLLIFHNEGFAIPTFRITSVVNTPQGVALAWQSAGGVKYRVQRCTSLAPGSFVDISGDLAGVQFTDTAPPAGPAFYRVVASPF